MNKNYNDKLRENVEILNSKEYMNNHNNKILLKKEKFQKMKKIFQYLNISFIQDGIIIKDIILMI